MRVYGALIAASLEPLASDPTAGVSGRIILNTTEGRVKLDDGTNLRALLRNDTKLVIGNSGTVTDNLRLHRGGVGILQLVLGNDVTAEGTLATTLGQLGLRVTNFLSTAKPVVGNAGRIIYTTDLNTVYVDTGSQWIAVGAGGGGGGGATWQPGAPAPTESYEYLEKVWLFDSSHTQSLSIFIKVPSSYNAGGPLRMRVGMYSPGTSNTVKLQSVATLIRKGTDAVTTTTNQQISTNGDTTLSTANLYQEALLDLSDTSGKINGVAISPGDVINVSLARVTPTGIEDTNDVRFLPSCTEVSFL